MELIEIGLVKEVVLPEIIELLYREGYKNTVTAKEQHYVENDMSKALIDCCIDNSIPVQFWKKHDTISLPDEASLSVLAPDNSIGLDRVEDDPNDASLIMFFKWQQIDVLLLADLTKQQELDLMSVWDNSEIIKVAHHGSRFTTGNHFLEKVQPEHAIISSGPNTHGHPAPEVIERLILSDCRVWRTDEGGCVIVNMGQGSKSIRYY
jgi:competence protein ComEC